MHYGAQVLRYSGVTPSLRTPLLEGHPFACTFGLHPSATRDVEFEVFELWCKDDP